LAEGIITTEDRLKKLVREKTMPKNRSEKEIAGYRDVLASIHENYDYIYPRPGYILQLHRDLYKFTGKAIGGTYKNSDNVITEEHAAGTKWKRQNEPIANAASAVSFRLFCREIYQYRKVDL
jgi:hypothetical protein